MSCNFLTLVTYDRKISYKCLQHRARAPWYLTPFENQPLGASRFLYSVSNMMPDDKENSISGK